ncbi:MAG: fumarylacetoacetase [Burkholderiaceae bacterium]|jgi:fumarylacetoacetase
MTYLNETHDPALTSWVESANHPDNGFPIQNLPFGTFRLRGTTEDFRPCVGIGDSVLDLAALSAANPFEGKAAQALAACMSNRLNSLMALGRDYSSALRLALSRALRTGSTLQQVLQPLLYPVDTIEMGLPATITGYTDFYASVHHATAVGKQFRPDNPLLPNYKWVPIGYHGRASSLAVSGQQFPRPLGQTRPVTDDGPPGFGPCKRLDYELELGIYIGRGNDLGDRIPIDDAESHIFGVSLLNDWSARDIQGWEYQPLGPFLSKNFASTLSPWIVTLEALAPFRHPFERPAGDPQPLPYLTSAQNTAAGAFDIAFDVFLTTRRSRELGEAPARLSGSNFRQAAYWTMAQLVAHHTVNGCNLLPGDLLGSGTLSGPGQGEEGSLLEITAGGKKPIELPWGEQRLFLEDHDEVILQGSCRKPGYPRISLGSCAGRVVPAKD